MYSEIIASYTPCLIPIAVAYRYYRFAQIRKVAVERSLQPQSKSLVREPSQIYESSRQTTQN